MNSYKALNKQEVTIGNFSIVPIRFEDRMDILKWRNEQVFHLRQNKPLTEIDQENYFSNVISGLFELKQPNQILFSYLEDGVCIGYGGLVHINWVDKNAEISFVMNTNLEKKHFQFHWKTYLELIEKIAFGELNFHKIFTYAFDLRPNLYDALESVGFSKEAILEEHCFFDGKYRDVVIHSKKRTERLKLCVAIFDNAQLLFDWANDNAVRRNSLSTRDILWEEHLKWFNSKLQSQSKIYLLFNDKIPVGQIRFDFINEFWVIDYSIDEKYRGKGFGKIILELAMKKFKKGDVLKANVKNENISSLKVFQKFGFEKMVDTDFNISSFIKKIN